MKYVVGIDQGTTRTKAVVVDRDGMIVSEASAELTQYYPKPGWVEHDPEEILGLTLKVFRAALDSAGLSPASVGALGITNQRETLTFWNRHTGAPACRAIVWQDRRTLPICEELLDRDGSGILDRTGAAIVPNAAGTKIRWLLENNEDIRRGVDAGDLICGTVDSWLLWKLTSGAKHATDRSNASVTLLLNARTREYDPGMLEMLGIPSEILPELVDTSGYLAHTDPAVTGAAIPVTALAGDQTASVLGQACIEPGMVKNTFGTGSFLVMNVGSEYRSPSLGIMAPVLWTIGDRADYGLEGYADSSGAGIQWLRDLGILASIDDAEPAAQTVDDNGGVFFVPAFAGLGSPHFDSYARGTMFGLSRGSSRGHLVRAALEASAYQVSDALHELQECSGMVANVVRVDGGAAKNNSLMQFQADILGIPVERPSVTETTALGAAMLAGIAAGVWTDIESACSVWTLDRRFEPSISAAERSQALASWHRAIDRSRGWLRPAEVSRP